MGGPKDSGQEHEGQETTRQSGADTAPASSDPAPNAQESEEAAEGPADVAKDTTASAGESGGDRAEDSADEGAAGDSADKPDESPDGDPKEGPGGDPDEGPGRDPDENAAADTPAGGRPPGRRSRRRVLRWTAAAAAVLLAGGGIAAYVLYRDLHNNIAREPVGEAQLGQNRPAKLNKSLNILLLGSDTRAGENSRYGGAANMPGARSDTTILLHLSPNRDRAVAVSFPRDSMVRIPACRRRGASPVPAQFGMLNSAFAYAGPTCTWKTLESLTGIHIDHYVQIDFAGFKRVVNALDGVEICVPKAINDPRAELFLKPGRQTLKGDDALGYVRARYSLGNGSDLERIERQQKFMAAVVNKATDTNLLANPRKTYDFLSAATKSISTDDKLTLSTMKRLADSLKGISAGTVRFVTVPVERYAPDPNRVQWNAAAARPLFEAIRADDDLPAPPPPAPGRPQQAAPKPAEVRIRIVDASGKKTGEGNPATRAVKVFAQRGFKVERKIETRPRTDANEIRFGATGEAKAGVVARLMPGGLLTEDNTVTGDTVVVVIGGRGFRLAPPAITEVGGVSAKQSACKNG